MCMQGYCMLRGRRGGYICHSGVPGMQYESIKTNTGAIFTSKATVCTEVLLKPTLQR